MEKIDSLKSKARTTSTRQTNISGIRGTYNLSPEIIELNKHKILRYEAEIKACKDCGGNCKRPESVKGFMPVLSIVGDAVYEFVAMCEYEKQKRAQVNINALFKTAKIPRRFENATFADYEITPENEQAVKAAHWIIDDRSGQGLFLYGERGTGKTMLAAIIANERIKRGKPVLFSSAPDLMADIRASFKSGNTEEVLLTAKTAAFLIIDDLGAERMTEWVAEQLFSIINYRYNERLPLIITSNYDARKIIERMAIIDRAGNVIDDIGGKRIMSRVYEMCSRIRLAGEDYRAR